MNERYFFVRDGHRYKTMAECVEKEGSGQLVAHHTLLDETQDMNSAYERVCQQLAATRAENLSLKVQMGDMSQQLAELRRQNQFTNSNWPHEKGLRERIAELEAQLAELQAKYDERGYAMQETGVMVRSLYDAQGNNKVLIERLKTAHEKIVNLEARALYTPGPDIGEDGEFFHGADK